MKHLLKALLLTVFLSSSAHAQIWQTASVLQKGAGSVGANAQFYFDPSEFMLNGQMMYGIGNNMQLEARIGAGGFDTYAGFFAKYHLLTNKIAAISLWSGLHSQGNAYWDLAPILSHDFGPVEFYFAPYIAISLGDRMSGVTMNPGLQFDAQPNLKVYGELALEVSHIPTNFTAGFRYLF